MSRKREEKFLDLVIQTKGIQGVAHSLNQMFEFDKLDGDNKLFCESCNEKTDTLKGYRIQKLPPILTIDLNRFDFDYTTFQRVKVNDRFEYPLELDLSAHLDAEAVELPENCIYELKSVIIHRGGAYGGHYHAFIQDELGEGNWHLDMPAEFKKDPEVVHKKAFNPKEHMTEAQIKAAEDVANQPEKPLTLNADAEKPKEDSTKESGKLTKK